MVSFMSTERQASAKERLHIMCEKMYLLRISEATEYCPRSLFHNCITVSLKVFLTRLWNSSIDAFLICILMYAELKQHSHFVQSVKISDGVRKVTRLTRKFMKAIIICRSHKGGREHFTVSRVTKSPDFWRLWIPYNVSFLSKPTVSLPSAVQ